MYFTSSHSEQICEKLRNSQGESADVGLLLPGGCSRTLDQDVTEERLSLCPVCAVL